MEDKIKEKIAKTIPKNFEININDLSKESAYDPATRHYDLGFMYVVFDVSPTHRITIRGDSETVVTIRGEKQIKRSTKTFYDDMIGVYKGKWYLIWHIAEIMR